MKKGRNIVRMPDEQTIAFLEDLLVELGYILPCEPEHIKDEDLTLYGKGTPRSLNELQKSFESLTSKRFATKGTSSEVAKSLAMAARNGTKISESVWEVMRADRSKAETGEQSHE